MLTRLINVALSFLMLWALYKSGCRIARIRELSFKAMAKASWPGILAFTLNEGLRFGRGLDYNLYAAGFYGSSSVDLWERFEPIYAYVTVFMKDNGLSFQWIVVLTSFTLIVSLVCFVRNFREAAPWGLPAFAVLYQQQAENLMRWFFGASFLIIGFSFLLKEGRKKKDVMLYVFFSVVSVLVHYGLFVMPVAYYLMILPKRPLLKPWMAISLFFLTAAYFQIKVMLAFTDYLNVFTLFSDRAEGYVSAGEQWLTSGSDILTFSAIGGRTFTAVCCVSAFLGYRLVKILDDRGYTILYNLFFVGFVVMPITNQLEIGSRYGLLLSLYQFVVWGYALKHLRPRDARLLKSRSASAVVLLICTGFVFKGQVVNKFVNPEYHLLYVWDKKGRKYLDLEKTYYKDLWEKKRQSGG